MTDYFRVGGIGAVAVMLALAMLVAPAMAAAPTVDTETTDTSTTSDWTGGTNVTAFEANGANSSYLESSFDSQNASIEIVDPESGTVHAMNDSDAMEQTAALDTDSSGSNDTWYYAWNMSHDALATMPMDANESKAVTVRFINDTEADSPDTTEITVFLENQEDRAVVYAGDAAANNEITGLDVENENASTFYGLGSEQSATTVEADNVGLGSTAAGTDVTVLMANTSDGDPFEQAQERGLISSASQEGDFIRFHSLRFDDTPYAVFNSEAPDGVLDDVTYAETTSVNGVDGMTVHVGDEYDGDATVDMTAGANSGYDISDGWVIEDRATGGVFANGLIPLTSGVGSGHLVA